MVRSLLLGARRSRYSSRSSRGRSGQLNYHASRTMIGGHVPMGKVGGGVNELVEAALYRSLSLSGKLGYLCSVCRRYMGRSQKGSQGHRTRGLLRATNSVREDSLVGNLVGVSRSYKGVRGVSPTIRPHDGGNCTSRDHIQVIRPISVRTNGLVRGACYQIRRSLGSRYYETKYGDR